MKRIKDLIAELAEQALIRRFCDSMKPKIGQMIERLTEQDRELIKQLKADDISNVRWPNPEYLLDTREEQSKERISKIRVKNYPLND